MPRTGGRALRGRQQEKDTLDRLLSDVRDGRSRVLVLRGEAGSGKTALLDYAAARSAPARLTRASGVEVESEITYSALQQLCAPLLGHLSALPEPQREALATAFGLSKGSPPDHLLVGLAVLSLFAEAAAEQPLVCVIDDLQWLDRMSEVILTFVARRLDAESVGLILASRCPAGDQLMLGLPEMRVDGLPDADARALLESVLTGPVDARVRDRIVAETRGNPLALLELPRGLSPTELAFGFGAAGTASVVGLVEQGFQRRIAALPADTRLLLLTAAVEPVGDVPLLWRALERLGVGPAAVAAAEAADLVEVGTRVRFRHPLVRSATWRSAAPADLRLVHRALADVRDPAAEPDLHAWHRAHAAVVPDEEVASELERSAGRAAERGGCFAAASFLERAAELTPDSKRRAGRALAAARIRLDAGFPALVPNLLAAAELGPLGPRERAEVERLRARVTFAVQPGTAAAEPLLATAKRLETLDTDAARETYLSAIGVAVHAGRLGGDLMRRATTAARELPDSDDPACLLLRGVTAWHLDGYRQSVPLLRRALSEVRMDHDSRLLWIASPVAHHVWDDAAWHRLTEQAVGFARTTGALSLLPTALVYRAGALLHAGRMADAAGLLDEADALRRTTGVAPHPSTLLTLVAHQGDATAVADLVEATVADAHQRGEGRLLALAAHAQAVLSAGLGQYSVALEAARRACEYEDVGVFNWALGELVEAAARSGDTAAAAEAAERLRERTTVAGTDWALGTQAIADALTGPARHAEDNYREGVERLAQTRIHSQLARARLLYGEWLRRENRRGAARTVLLQAHESFTVMGAQGFAERAARELLAAGETVRRRGRATFDQLTAQETQIARLAVAGRTNAEIGAALFLSPRTVEWHLRKVFAKLGISSRRELAAATRTG
ncbi:helix-turn-helix domain-containing protein [Actinoplanes sp. TBRC 11911]|uniref:ATP-binding protein n=1 Tax=Actinoplanes sp. TBRC 11911 TaxID=2729386 RepID=UPI00145CCB31|nr:LuxR family transcriptional regulator [Actinoplanes sp. TBRC 11911]NMO49667.1 helix-turn-helix domain-containing protein [Actinoplanes sp. TBRC 11911]